MEWRLRCVVPAAVVTIHAKPHAQQQLPRDLEVERCHAAALSATKFWRGTARQSAPTSIAGFMLNFSSAAVELETKAESEPATSLSGNLYMAWVNMVCSRSDVRLYAATPRSGPGLLCAAARFVSAMYATVRVLSRICRPQE